MDRRLIIDFKFRWTISFIPIKHPLGESTETYDVKVATFNISSQIRLDVYL